MSADTDKAAGEVLVQGSTVYVLNERGVNRWVAQVQAGRDDNDERTSDAECRAIAQRIADALSTPPAVVPAVPSDAVDAKLFRWLLAHRVSLNSAFQWRHSGDSEAIRAMIAGFADLDLPQTLQPQAVALHPATADLVRRFTEALAAKLAAAEKKYGYSDGWLSPDWMDECRAKLLEHVAKGDPRDVAAYCAFLWHHGENTAATPAAPSYGVLPVWWARFMQELTLQAEEEVRADLPGVLEVCALDAIAALAQPAPVQPTTINSEPATAHSLLAALIDIYDDAQSAAPEDRCYVESAWPDVLKESRAFLAAPAAPFIHKKTGGKYQFVGNARLQVSVGPLNDMDYMVVYRGEDGKLWVRPSDEFTERFYQEGRPGLLRDDFLAAEQEAVDATGGMLAGVPDKAPAPASEAVGVWQPSADELVANCLDNSLKRAAGLLRSTGHAGDSIDAGRLEYLRITLAAPPQAAGKDGAQ